MSRALTGPPDLQIRVAKAAGAVGALLLCTTLLLGSLLAHDSGCDELAIGFAMAAFLVSATCVYVTRRRERRRAGASTGEPQIQP